MKNKPSRPSFLIYPKVLDKKKALTALAVKASVHYGLLVFFRLQHLFQQMLFCISFFLFQHKLFFSISSFSAGAFFSRCSFFLQRILVKGVEHGREVTLACVGENGYDGLALVLGTLCQLGSSKGGST